MTVLSLAGRDRSVAIDALRVMGVALVAAGHLWGDRLTTGLNAGNLAAFSWQVPLFFFLSGYLWKYGRRFRDDVAKRARSLLVPFAAWTLLLGVPVCVVLLIRGIDPTRDIGAVVWGGGNLKGPFAPYWFLPVFFLTTVLARVLERGPRWVSWVAALLGVVMGYFFGGQLAHVPHDVLFALPCLVFVLAGQELARVRSRITRPVGLALVTLALCAAVVALRLLHPLDIKSGNFGTPVASIAIAIAVCGSLTLLAQSVLETQGRRIRLLVMELAASLIVVLLLHTFCFDALILFSEHVVKLRTPIIFVIGLGIAWTVGSLIRRTALSEVLSGVPRVPALLSTRVRR